MQGRNTLDGSFGNESVTAAERRQRIGLVFRAVAPRYDLMNDMMSFGIHRWWKRTLARRVAAVSGVAVDLAGGTGDVARLLVDGERRVVVCDPSLPMMMAGRKRGRGGLAWLAGEAERMPLGDASVDLLTVAFGLRNATQLEWRWPRSGVSSSPAAVSSASNFRGPRCGWRPSTTSIPFSSFRAWARWWRASRRPTSTWSSRSGAFPTRVTLPP
jgi:hypothetical protein